MVGIISLPPPPLLTLTNYFITYWTFKKCVIKTRQAVSSKCGLFLNVLTYIDDTDQLFYSFEKSVFKTSQVVSSKCGPSLGILTGFFRELKHKKKNWHWLTNNCFNTYWTFKKYVIKISQVVSSKYGLSLNVLTDIFESWRRWTNLTLTNYFITYWTFKKCVIKTSQVVRFL